MKLAIPYYRVSTDRQGISGLGLDAQRLAVKEYAARSNFELMDEFTEIESGTRKKRPVLTKALEQCKQNKAILLIAKLDRLGRNIVFIAKLMESDIEFVAVDYPDANKLTLHIMAVFAEHERDQTSKRTIAALAEAKKRGVKLGEHGANVLSKMNKQQAIDFAMKMKPEIEKLKSEGFTTTRALVKELNRRNISTYQGNDAKWHIQSVHKLLQRIASL
jgi:DNA invertase Pin-like site-specific DNA recombinase